jgi:predicted Rossmann-fold nucleotide-binding protein
MKKTITCFCSSKNNISHIYVKNYKENICGKVISSNLEKFAEKDLFDDYLFTSIDDRQKKMIELGDIYLVLPGGYGTLFEALEVMTKNDISETNKPIYMLNTNNVYSHMFDHINHMIDQGFITRDLNKINMIIDNNPENIALVNMIFYNH